MYESRVVCPNCGHSEFRVVQTHDILWYFGDLTKMYRTEKECKRCRFQW